MPTRGKKAAAEPVPEPVAEPEPPPPPPPEPVVKHISVAAAFHEAQLSFAKHRKCVEALQAARAAAKDVAEWDDEYFSCVACVLPIYKREAAAERIIEFVVRFATQHGGEVDVDEAFVEGLCFRLLKLANHKDKAVRFRVVQLTGRIMNQMAEEAEVSDDLFESIEKSMLARCRDKVPLVRAWALKGLFRLQDPSQPGDAITSELLRLMSEDTAKEVRMAAISTVAPSKHAIRAIMLRTRDSCAEVRLHALAVLRDKVEMRWLSISQRVHLLEGALLDRTPSVANACAEMLTGGWLRKGCDNDVLTLLRALDAVAPERVAADRATHGRVAQLALDVLITKDKTTRDLVMSAALKHWGDEEHERQAESAICLRAILAYYAGAGKDTEGIAPELPKMCAALRKAADAFEAAKTEGAKVAATCIVSELAKASQYCDFANEAGRQTLSELTAELLRNLGTSDEALSPLFIALEATCMGDQGVFQRQIMEVISEVEDPLEAVDGDDTDAAEADARLEREQASMFAQARLAEIRNDIANKLAEDDEEAAEILKEEATKVMAKLNELERAGKESPEVAFAREARCLRLSLLLLQAPTIGLAEHECAQLGQRFLPPLQSPEVELRELAITCLGLHCHASSKLAKKYFPLFSKAMIHDQPQVQLAALRAICDLLLMHSPCEVITLEATPDVTDNDGSPAAIAAIKAANAEKAAIIAASDATAAKLPLVRIEDAYSHEVSKLLIPMLENTSSSGALRTTAALGLAKLMHAGALQSSNLLAKLLLVYFDGTDDVMMADPVARKQSAELSQQLSVFFAAGGGASNSLATALLPACRTVFNAPEGSRASNIGVEGLIAFVLGLADDAVGLADRGATTEAISTHAQLCTLLCCEALLCINNDGIEARVLPRAFNQMALPLSVAAYGGRASLHSLYELLEDLIEGLEDKTALKGVERMKAHLKELMASMTDAEAEEEKEEEKHINGAQMLAAHKALKLADASSENARKKLIEAKEMVEMPAKQVSPKQPGGKRKLAKVKPQGLTPAKENMGHRARLLA